MRTSLRGSASDPVIASRRRGNPAFKNIVILNAVKDLEAKILRFAQNDEVDCFVALLLAMT
jgi:hypothetical protein